MGSIHALVTDPGLRTIVPLYYSGQLELRDGSTGAPLGETYANGVQWWVAGTLLPGGRGVVVADDEGLLARWEPGSATPYRVLRRGPRIVALATSPDGRHVLACGADRSLALIEHETGEVVERIVLEERGTTAAFPANDAKTAFVGTARGRVLRIAVR
jgi:hypothetical protein